MLYLRSISMFVLWALSADTYAQVSIIKPVDIGGCFDTNDDTFLHCAALEKECEVVGRVRFKTAAQLRILGIESCTSETLRIGQCGDSGSCALTPDACNDKSTYIPPPRRDTRTDGYCSAQKFISSAPENAKPTQYGGCLHGTSNEIACMLSPADCSDRESWISAERALELKEGGCQCHNVYVGLCQGGFSHGSGSAYDEAHCAISENDCVFTGFIPARDVLIHEHYPGLLDCRLCSAVSPQSTSSSTRRPTPVPMSPASTRPEYRSPPPSPTATGMDRNFDSETNSSSATKNTAIFGVIVAIGFMVVVTVVVALIVSRRRRRPKPPVTEGKIEYEVRDDFFAESTLKLATGGIV